MLVELGLVDTLRDAVEVGEKVGGRLPGLVLSLAGLAQEVVDQRLGVYFLLDIKRRGMDTEVRPVLLVFAAPDELRIQGSGTITTYRLRSDYTFSGSTAMFSILKELSSYFAFVLPPRRGQGARRGYHFRGNSGLPFIRSASRSLMRPSPSASKVAVLLPSEPRGGGILPCGTERSSGLRFSSDVVVSGDDGLPRTMAVSAGEETADAGVDESCPLTFVLRPESVRVEFNPPAGAVRSPSAACTKLTIAVR